MAFRALLISAFIVLPCLAAGEDPLGLKRPLE